LVWIRVERKVQEPADVKAQIEFNPARVAEYRVIGYEDQIKSAYDHRPEARVDRGPGFSVLLQIVPSGTEVKGTSAEGCWPSLLKFNDDTKAPSIADPALACSMLALKVRYKIAGRSESRFFELFLTDHGEKYSGSSRDLRFVAAVAEFGMILRDSPFKGTSSLESVIQRARSGIENDRDSLRTGFIRLVEQADRIAAGK
jgi:Ca-activated chloride channel family protein